MICPPFPPVATGIAAGIVQIGITLLAVITSARAYGGLFFALICMVYMTLHVWDLLRDGPMIAPLSAAMVRIIVRVFFIRAGWRLRKKMGF